MSAATIVHDPMPPRVSGTPVQLVDRALIRAHLAAGMTFFVLAVLTGLLFSLQFLQLYPFPTIQFLSPGRVRMEHTSSIAFGFFVNSFYGLMYWVVPRLTGRPLLSRKLGWFAFWFWQACVVASSVGILTGFAQAIEWGETPVWIDPLILVGAAMLIINTVGPVLRRHEREMYVTLWYVSAGFVWTALTYFMGNFVPQYWLPGAAGAAVTGLYIHDLVGLFITPMGWGLMYYMIPVILKKPVWSHTLSIVGFWGLAFFYPLNGIHHFLYSPIPMYAQYGAIISTIAVEFVVATVIFNFAMTLRGSGDALRTSLPIRYFYTGMGFYFLTCLQCSFQTTLTLQRLIHFSDWVVGHAHMVMFGVFGMWILGSIDYMWPKLTGKAWRSERARYWQYWLAFAGIGIMSLDLMICGVVQGSLWMTLAPWQESVIASVPYWAIRSGAGLMMTIAVLMTAFHMWITARGDVTESKPVADATAPAAA